MFHHFWSNITGDIHFTSFVNQFLKSFSLILKCHRPKTARCTRCTVPRGADPRVSRSRGRAVVDRPALAAGELAGGEVTTRGSPRRGGPDAPRTGTGETRKEARWRAWRVGGAAHRRPTISGREGAREVVWELHRARAVFVHAKGEREGGRRGEVHGAECSGELGHNSDERFSRRGSFSRLTKVSTRCARRRRSYGRDGGFNGELGRSRERVSARRGARL